jgi:AraC-like DNA-binding protein
MLQKYLENVSIEVEPFALCLLDSGWRLSLPGPPVTMLHFVVSGDGWMTSAEGGRVPVGANCVAVVPHGVQHSLETRGHIHDELNIPCTPDGPPVHRIVAGDSGPLEMVVGCGTLRARFRIALGLFDQLKKIVIADLSSVPEAPALFQSILAEQSQMKQGSLVLQSAMMTQLLVHFFRVISDQSDTPIPWLAALEDQRLAQALDKIMEDPGAHHTVESLAREANMSRSAFAKHFTEVFDRSPMSLVNSVRLEEAARFLKNSQHSVDTVAGRFGFASRSHFSQAFKKHMGVSPAEYRRD